MVFFCGREYDLLYSILYILDHNIQGAVFVISKGLPNLGYREKLLKQPFVKEVIEVDDDKLHEKYFFKYKKPIFGMVANLLFLRFKARFFYKKKLNNFIKNNKTAVVHLFFINTALKIYIYRNFSNVVFLEEGAGIYNKNYPASYLFIRWMLRLGDPYGRDLKVRNIVLSQKNLYKYECRKKIKTFIFHDSLNRNISNESLQEVFGINRLVVSDDDKIAIILTQPISEDGLCSESEKSEFYKEIFFILSKSYDVYLKAHPRDLTEYSWIDDEKIIEKSLMIELVEFSKDIDLVVSLNSTACNNIRRCRSMKTLLPNKEFSGFSEIDLDQLNEI